MHFWGIEMSYKEKGPWLGSHVFTYLIQETLSLFPHLSSLPLSLPLPSFSFPGFPGPQWILGLRRRCLVHVSMRKAYGLLQTLLQPLLWAPARPVVISSILVLLPACCCSVAQSCLTFCDLMGCCTPSFPVVHHFPELAETHVQNQRDGVKGFGFKLGSATQ